MILLFFCFHGSEWHQVTLILRNPKCVVAYSALPSKVLPLVDSSNAKVVGELIDLSPLALSSDLGMGQVTHEIRLWLGE